MEYRRFGKTNLNLSVFSLGTMRCLSSPEVFWETVHHALTLGVNHIETARGYGESEEYLGTALQRLSSTNLPKPIVTTKIPPTNNPKLIDQWINESLNKLKLDSIDCLAIHGINLPEHLDWFINDMYPDCLKALDRGIIGHLGFSSHGSLDLIMAAIETKVFSFVNLHYYYFFQHLRPAIDLAHQYDMGVFIISPADKGGKLYTPPESLAKLCQPLTPLELNYRFLLSDRRITTLSMGPSNPAEVMTSLQFGDNCTPLNSQEQEIIDRLEEQLINSLNSDLCSQCYACLPCPEGINIPEVLRLRNLAIAYDMVDYGQYRYRMFENAGHWFWGTKGDRCTECGDCLPKCPAQLNIPELIFDTHDRLKTSDGRRLWE